MSTATNTRSVPVPYYPAGGYLTVEVPSGKTVWVPVPPFCWAAACYSCESFSEVMTRDDAGRAAAEHDHEHHHGEPTATVERV